MSRHFIRSTLDRVFELEYVLRKVRAHIIVMSILKDRNSMAKHVASGRERGCRLPRCNKQIHRLIYERNSYQIIST